MSERWVEGQHEGATPRSLAPLATKLAAGIFCHERPQALLADMSSTWTCCLRVRRVLWRCTNAPATTAVEQPLRHRRRPWRSRKSTNRPATLIVVTVTMDQERRGARLSPGSPCQASCLHRTYRRDRRVIMQAQQHPGFFSRLAQTSASTSWLIRRLSRAM